MTGQIRAVSGLPRRRERGRWTHGVAALLGLISLLAGCASSPPDGRESPTSTAVGVRTALAHLTVAARPGPDPAYRRADFGSAWADTDHDGCSQRRDALAAAVDRTKPFTERRRGRCIHDVVAGTWTDPYTGLPLTFTDLSDSQQAQQIPIDHVVALAVAYRYGANRWTAEQRLAFATDLSNLQPTARATNSKKSDRDAASWRPGRRYQCDYATRYVSIKAKYALRVDEMEKRALSEMLNAC